MEEVFSPHLIGQLSKASPTPLYHQLFSLLKARILDGTLALGCVCPLKNSSRVCLTFLVLPQSAPWMT